MARDYFAEMYVAGILADKGWNVYFPRRDKGFDFIITKSVGDKILIRPVQVKSKNPEVEGRNLSAYGFIGPLSQLHVDMVLAIPYFSTDLETASPDHIAYMPIVQISKTTKERYVCMPAKVVEGVIQPKAKYEKYFGAAGIALMEQDDWNILT